MKFSSLVSFMIGITLLSGCPKDRQEGYTPTVADQTSSGSDQAVPIIGCKSPNHDFGVRERGVVASHSFEILNSGASELKIARVHGGSQVEAQATAATIPPGGKAEILVNLTCAGRLGLLKRSVTVYSNDPKTPRLQLKVQAKLEALLAFQPERVFMRNVPKGQRVTKTVTLTGRSAQGTVLAEPVSNKPDEVTAKVIEHQGGSALEITFQAGQKEGRVSAQITANTSLAKVPQLILPVVASVTGDLVADRRVASFFQPKGEKPSTFSLNVSSLSKKPFKITKVEDPTGRVSGTISPGERGVRVELSLAQVATTTTGKVSLHTDRQDQPVLQIGYVIRQARKGLPKHQRIKMDPSRLPPIKKVRTGQPEYTKPSRMNRASEHQHIHLKDNRKAPPLPQPPPGVQSQPSK